MKLFKEAGGNCLATYIPWLIHEPTEGHFKFGGKTGTHDVEGFLETAAEEGLYVIARPGPYQYSELLYDGLPRWLCENYPELHAHNIKGKMIRQSSISYLHPLFLEKVERWFAAICPLLSRWTVSKGGPLAFTQFDNEMGGIHIWFGSLDYNAKTLGLSDPMGRFPKFLENRYREISRLNKLYETTFADFASVLPPVPLPTSRLAEIRRMKDFFNFYQSMLAEYANILCSLMQQYGIDTPFVHNSAGPSMNAWFKPMVDSIRYPFILGSDHYYTLGQEWGQNNPTPQHATQIFTSMEMLRVMGMPPTVFELPGGSLSDWPPITPHDAKACYLMNIAFGMKASNFYIFTGGPNIPGTGTTSDIYDYGAAIGPRGEIRPLYKIQKDLGLFLKKNSWLVEAEHETGVRVGLDFDMPIAENYGWEARGELAITPADSWRFIHRGILSTAFCASLSPTFVDLSKESWMEDLGTPLIVVTSAVMARPIQEQLVRFLKNGGRLLLLPVMPTHDENLEPCTVLSDHLNGVITVRNHSQFTRVTVAGVANVYMNGEVFFLENLPSDAKIVGIDEISGRTLAAQWKPKDGGEVLIMGFRWLHAKREHELMLISLVKNLGFKAKVICSNPNIWVTLRTTGKQSALFLMNLLSAPMETRVKCRPAWSKKMIDTKNHKLEPMSVKVILLSENHKLRYGL